MTATVVAVLLIILGILVVVYPGLLVWLVGIGLVLAGVALLAATLTAAGRAGSVPPLSRGPGPWPTHTRPPGGAPITCTASPVVLPNGRPLTVSSFAPG